MNHAFLVICHQKPIVLQRAITLLLSSNHYFFIHVDKKYKRIEDFDVLKHLQNVFILKKRLTVNWGGFSQVKATICLLKTALAAEVRFDYLHLISGADFPCVSSKVFDAFFENSNRSYLCYDLNNNTELCEYRINSFHFKDFVCKIPYTLFFRDKVEQLMNTYIKRKNVGQLYKGANWFSITSNVAQFILRFIKDNPEYYSRFKYTECCDEIFFHTMLYSYKDKLEIDTSTNLRYIDWAPDRSTESLPLVLEEVDFDKIKKSGAVLCRKIDPVKSRKLIYLLEKDIMQ